MGVCNLLGIHRRIDIKYYPRDQFGYAILYFTGSDHFNRFVLIDKLKEYETFCPEKGILIERSWVISN
jgi:DNA polymerase/3'-5' exonuclease PolX